MKEFLAMISAPPKDNSQALDYSKMTDEELLESLKKSDVFDKLVFPTTWHKKFSDLPKAEARNTKEYIKESPWMRKFEHVYADGGKILDIDAKPGGVRPVLPAPEIPTMTVQKNMFSDAPTDQSENANPQEIRVLSVNSTDTNETKSQE